MEGRVSLKNLFRTIAIDMFEDGRTVVPDDIIRTAMLKFPVEFAEESDRLVRNAAKNEVTAVLKDLSDDDGSGQLALPGLSLPTVIALPTEGGYVYKPSAACDWPEVVQGRQVRADNVSAAQAKLDNYDDNLSRLRPVMEGTSLTVAEAARILLGDAA
jgi:hypothetical protein